MKGILIALCAILAVSSARVVITATGPDAPHLLGAKECTWGPSYWCESIKTAAGCNATKHCIKKVWETMKVPVDNDNVCTICKDMVQQARDQLESNQTMNDLKLVFEGSCILIRIKPIVKECINLVDEFIPQLVETLASQMNPSIVCSVAGLCNSEHIDKLLLEYHQAEPQIANKKFPVLKNDELEPDECSKCYTVASHMQHKLTTASRDEVLKNALTLCGDLSSFSDACSSIVLTHFDTIYSHLQENFNADSICHLSGQCAANFHKHEGDMEMTPKVEIRPLSSVGMVEVGDDLPCKLCEQLVSHLKDLLVANTTEAEFQQVLEGLCKQTKSFATECTTIVDEYYPQMYEYLTKGLNTNLVCQMSGICPKPGGQLEDIPIWPLLPAEQREIGLRILKPVKKNVETKKMAEVSEAEAMQLPIERMMPFPIQQELTLSGKQSCALCEYVLHFIQEALTNPSNEEKVKEIIGKVCTKIPQSLQGECTEFVNTYGDAVVAILAQEIDPSQVCPTLHLCPSEEWTNIWKNAAKELVQAETVEWKPSCPLCLLAMSQIYNVIRSNETEANIEEQLNKLCTHLPTDLVDECDDLVKGYSKEIVEMLLADLTPQEICVYIKLCDATKDPGPAVSGPFIVDKDGEIMTNEIPTYSVQPTKPPTALSDPSCVICEFVMQYVDKAIGSKKSKDEIEKVVHGVCNHLPHTISKQCNHFVDEYADVLIDILSHEVSPKEACSMLGMCALPSAQIEASVAECALCQAVLSTIDKLLANPKIDAEIEEVVARACKYIPPSKQKKCTTMIEVYGQSIINLLRQNENPKKICSKMALCSTSDFLAMNVQSSRMRRSFENSDIGMKRCTWGREYWCVSNETARQCRAINYCKKHVWKSESAPPSTETVSSEAQISV